MGQCTRGGWVDSSHYLLLVSGLCVGGLVWVNVLTQLHALSVSLWYVSVVYVIFTGSHGSVVRVLDCD